MSSVRLVIDGDLVGNDRGLGDGCTQNFTVWSMNSFAWESFGGKVTNNTVINQ